MSLLITSANSLDPDQVQHILHYELTFYLITNVGPCDLFIKMRPNLKIPVFRVARPFLNVLVKLGHFFSGFLENQLFYAF